MKKIFFTILTFVTIRSFAQTAIEPVIFRITSSHTSFPDTGRANGHRYDNVLYSTAEHYSDSSVLIIVPPGLKATNKVDIVCWFHGWGNNIDSIPPRYDLVKQFLAAGSNAILVLAETAKDAPDSYGGKLEQQAIFKLLLNDVLNKLSTEKVISKRTGIGNVILAGHSGAYRVMANILQNGAVEVNETILFDALYGEVKKFTDWIQADAKHRFIDIYTDKGGTDKLSIVLAQQLRESNVTDINIEEKDVDATLLKNNNIIFIHSLKEHNDIINRPDDNFQLFLESSRVLKKIKK